MATTTTRQQVLLDPTTESGKRAIFDTLFGTYGQKGVADVAIGTPEYAKYVEGFDPMQQAALDRAATAFTGGLGGYEAALAKAQPLFQEQAQAAREAAAGYDPSMAEDFRTGLQQEVIDRGIADIQRAGDLREQQIAAQAIGAGAFGGSRQAVQEGISAGEEARAIGDLSARLNLQAEQMAQQQAQQAFEQQQARGLQAAGILGTTGSQLGSLAGLQQSLAGQDITRQFGIGQLAQGQRQSVLDAQLRSQQELLTEPQRRLGFAANIVAGQPFTQSQLISKETPNASRSSQMLGTGLALLGAGSGFSNPFASND